MVRLGLRRGRSSSVSSIRVAQGLTRKIVADARKEPGKVAFGILLGESSDDTIHIHSFYPAVSDPQLVHDKIPNELIPKVVNDKTITANIVGWYRSKLSGQPITVSEQDKRIQSWFQQSEPKAAMMLLDPEKGAAWFYRIDANGNPIGVRAEKVPATTITAVPIIDLVPPPPPPPPVPIIDVTHKPKPKPPPKPAPEILEIAAPAPIEVPLPQVEPLTESSHQIAPAVDVTVKCSSCACENAGDASFCSKCGASLTPAPPLTLVTSQSSSLRSLVVNPQEVQSQLYSTPTEPVSAPIGMSRPKKRLEWKFIGLILIVIILSFSIIGVFTYYQGYRIFPSTLQISHSPPGGLVIGNSVTFTATVTGGTVSNVLLTYRILQHVQGSQGFILSDLTQTAMFLATQDSTTYT